MNCISYSLFGYKNKHDDCYDFTSFLRYLTLVIRMNKLLYPNWVNLVNMDRNTYESEYKEIFDFLSDKGWMKLNIHNQTDPLCKSMLWRLEPVWMGYEYVLCRDMDSLACYKEAAAVQEFTELGTKSIHAMTDSVSHGITLMGGMIGIKSDSFRIRTSAGSWQHLLNMCAIKNLDYNKKGADQDFLNSTVLPMMGDSMVEHFFLGHPQSFRGTCKVGIGIVDGVVVKDIPDELKETNYLISHIGQAGFILEPVLKFFVRQDLLENEISQVEKKYPNIFHWWLTR